jgi:hypothetical protein
LQQQEKIEADQKGTRSRGAVGAGPRSGCEILRKQRHGRAGRAPFSLARLAAQNPSEGGMAPASMVHAHRQQLVVSFRLLLSRARQRNSLVLNGGYHGRQAQEVRSQESGALMVMEK